MSKESFKQKAGEKLEERAEAALERADISPEEVTKKIDAAEQRIDEAAERVEVAAAAANERKEEFVDRADRLSTLFVNSETGKVSRGVRVFAIINFVSSLLMIVVVVLTALALVTYWNDGVHQALEGVTKQAIVLTVVKILVSTAQACLLVAFSVRVLRNKLRNAVLLTDIMLWVAVIDLVLSLMVAGLYSASTLSDTIVLIYLVVMHSFLDPQLTSERRLQRKLHDMELRDDQESGVLGRDKTGEGFIELNFFNLFWIFVVACFLGWCMEMAVCPILNGRIEDRTGMLWGPFSPIYGIGATLMTIALNRLYKKNLIIVFLIAGLIGAGFEFFVHWFFENSFGIVAWDYSGEPFNIQGRTDLMHFVAWGFVGMVFVRWIMPRLLKIVNLIPWNWRYSVTVLAATFMIANGVMTLTAFDCWFQRVSGHTPDTPIAEFCAEHYDNDFMQKHFPTMSIDPNRTTHE